MRWRLLLDEAAHGAVNMAVDEALLDSAQAPDFSPTVRFYQFSTPTLTFGYGQDLSQAADEESCRNLQIDCIRRITGGRALLHQHELTYSVTAPSTCPLFSASVKSPYRAVRSTIRAALAGLGVPMDPEGRVPRAERAPARLPCLSVPTGHEITTGGRKIVAASMRRRRRGFLIHGSILWAIDRSLWRQITGLSGESMLRAAGIREACPHLFGEAELIDAVTSSFKKLLGGPPERGVLNRDEKSRVQQLVAKYRSEEWKRRIRGRISVG